MDIVELLKAPLKDGDWPKKIILMGLIGLIPILGQLNTMGWLVAVYETRAGGEEDDLPPVGLQYMGRGFQLFLAFLPALGAVLALNVVVALLAKVAGFLGALAGVGASLVGLALWVVAPAIVFLHVARGAKWASADVAGIRQLVTKDRTAYLALMLVYVVANVAGGLGSALTCGVGSIVAVPWIAAVTGGALAAFRAETKA